MGTTPDSHNMNNISKITKKEIVTAFRTREILDAARTLLEQRGLEALTMEEIAAVAGVAKGTLYLYFESKDDLIQALITLVGENILRDVEAVLREPGTPSEAFFSAPCYRISVLRTTPAFKPSICTPTASWQRARWQC